MLAKKGAQKRGAFFLWESDDNGAYRDRTCDLLVANQALSQLS